MDAIKIKRMKSIDEAGVEWHLSHPDADKEETWKVGANYVLYEIGRIVNSAIENKSMTIPTWRLNYIIEQLKK